MKSMKAIDLTVGQDVFISKTEGFWDKPYTMKRSHVYDTRRVVLRGEVIEVRGIEFKARLKDNNGFDKDGEVFVFNEGELLCNQDFTDFDKLGKWA